MQGNSSYPIIAALNVFRIITFLDTTITTDIEYTYLICGYSDQNKSEFTREVKATALFPSPYSLKFTALSDTSIKLTWQDSCGFEKGF